MTVRHLTLAGALVALASGCAHEARVESTSAPICAGPKADADANKALVLRFAAELWDAKNPDAALNGILAPDVVNHAAVPDAQGAEGMRTISRKIMTAFPDMTMKRLDAIAEGDRVVVRTLFEGTQTAPLEFKQPIPATGKHVRLEQVETFRLKGGKIVEMWMTMDRLDLMRQLGLV